MRSSSLGRRVLVLLAIVLAAAGCTDAGELGGPSIGGTAAAVVGDVSFSAADLETEADLWASNPEFLRLIGINDPGRPGVRTADLTAFVLSHRILSEQARQLGEAAGYEPSTAEVDEILAAIDGQFTTPEGGSLFLVFPEAFRRLLGTDLAFQQNLQNIPPQGVTAPEVAVASRYGVAEVVDVDLGIVQVTPPVGPRPAPLQLDIP